MSLVHHTTFRIERELPGTPRHAFRFWSDKGLKRQWTSCHPDWQVLSDELDVRVGGVEATNWRTGNGIELGYEARYLDIRPGALILYSYTMSEGNTLVSASLSTVELFGEGDRTRMVFTEQAALTRAADGEQREVGTGIGFDFLVAAMERELAPSH